MLQELQDTAIKAELTVLNEKINQSEIDRDDAARTTFATYLHDDLYFKRADDSSVKKEGFIISLYKPNPYTSRDIGDFEFYQLSANRILVCCIVKTKKGEGTNFQYYRNLRFFEMVGEKWLLHVWYNYEIVP